ncbi:MAG: flagellar hook assembly protein FlgD [Nitrospirae bacterium]|nr:flagellar hook assembly protein FlgD [Candidatus Manganitrophaceae bacterium]
MAINATQATQTTPPTQSTAVTQAVNQLGADTFLRLLTAQLQFQDPLQPMDSTQFVTQLAQFSQVEKAVDMNKSIGTLTQYMASINNYSAAGLIGKNVQVEGSTIPVNGNTSPTLSYQLGGDAKQVLIQISDREGNVVRSLRAGAQPAGLQTVTWNGLDDQGNRLPSGEYTLNVAAVDGSGQPVQATTYTHGQVTGVTFENNIAYLMVNGARVPASGVLRIDN